MALTRVSNKVLNQSVDTINDLPETGYDGQTIEVLGYTTAGDGGGGTFRYSTTSATNNGGTIILPSLTMPDYTATAGSCWHRQYSGAVNVKWFGAYSDGTNSTTTTTAIQATIDFVAGGAVYAPSGTYLLDDQIEANPACSLSGDGDSTVFKLKDATSIEQGGYPYDDKIFWFKNGSNVTLKDFYIDENYRGNPTTTNTSGSIHCSDVDELKIIRVKIYDTNNVGITIAGSGGAPGNCDGVLIDGCTVLSISAGTNQEGIKTSGNRRVRIINNYLRTMFDDCISVNGFYTSIPATYNDGDRDLVISNNVCEAWSRAIIIDGWVEGVTITGNTCRPMDGTTLSSNMIVVTNVYSGGDISYSAYPRDISIVGNSIEMLASNTIATNGILVNCVDNLSISGNNINMTGTGTTTTAGILIDEGATVTYLRNVNISGNNIVGVDRGIVLNASGSEFPINVSVTSNNIINTTNPVYITGEYTLDKYLYFSDNTGTGSGIKWDSVAIGAIRDGGGNLWNYSSGMPTSGEWAVGQEIINTNVYEGAPRGWFCTIEGTATSSNCLFAPMLSHSGFVAKTASYPITHVENGTRYSNFGATGNITFTLPAGYTGMTFEFANISGNNIILNRTGSDVFVGGTTTCTLGGTAFTRVTNSGGVWFITNAYGSVVLS